MTAAQLNHGDRLDPRELASYAATTYVNALAGALPFDHAPGDINLLAAAVAIQDALLAETKASDHADEDREQAAMRAGYLLGVQIGLQMRAR